jgi:transposase
LTCACGHQLVKIGEDISEKLMMVPAQIWVARHHHSKYACKHCEGLSDESKPAVIRAQGEPDLIARSIVSASLLAHIWTAKFCDHLPFYRQEAGFARIGAEISRQNMVNWTMTVSGELEPLMDLIETQIREGPLINMDETPVKVLKMPHTGKEGQGYMWLVRGGTRERKAVRYRFAPGRGSQHAKAILTNFRGYLQTDAFGAYDVVAQDGQVTQVGCWAHARRKFMDADKVAPSNLTKDALGRIRKLYELEKTCREHAKKQSLSDEEFHEYRRSVLVPFLDALKDWMDATAAATLPSGATGKAFAYTAGQWDKLERYLEHPWMTPDNNLAENAIRPFVLGRKNWLFHGNEEGAEASCRVYTLIETAKMNRLEPWAYLKDLLEKLPAVRISGDWDSLLPWNINQGKN